MLQCSLEGRANCVAKAGEGARGLQLMWPLAQPGPHTTEAERPPHTDGASVGSFQDNTLHRLGLRPPAAVRYRWPMREREPLHHRAFCDLAHRSSGHVFRPSRAPVSPTGGLPLLLNQGVPNTKKLVAQFTPWLGLHLAQLWVKIWAR